MTPDLLMWLTVILGVFGLGMTIFVQYLKARSRDRTRKRLLEGLCADVAKSRERASR